MPVGYDSGRSASSRRRRSATPATSSIASGARTRAGSTAAATAISSTVAVPRPGSASYTRRSPSPSSSSGRRRTRLGSEANSPIRPTNSTTSSARVIDFGARPQQRVTSARRRRCHRPRHRADDSAQRARPRGGVRRAAAQAGLHHYRRPGERGHQPVAGQEPVPGRSHPGRIFGDQQPVRGDAMQQRGMPCGIRNVEPTRQHRHGDAVDGQRRAVRGAVDAVGAAGDHRDVALGQSDRQVGGHVFAVAGCRPGSDDRRRHAAPTSSRRAAPSAHSTSGGLPCGLPGERRTAERGERQRRPFVVVGRDQPTAAAGQQFEILGSTVDFTPGFGTPRQAVVDLASPDPLGRFDRTHPPHQVRPARRTAARRPATGRPTRARVASVIATLPAAGSSARSPPRRVPATCAPPSHSASTRPASVRSRPRMLNIPRSSAVRSGSIAALPGRNRRRSSVPLTSALVRNPCSRQRCAAASRATVTR